MSIQEFHSRMKSEAAYGSLFEALGRLRTVEGASRFFGETGEDPFESWQPWNGPGPS